MSDNQNNEKVTFKSGVQSRKQVNLALIPHKGLVNAARRFEVGVENYKDKAYNNLSINHQALNDKEWLIDRVSHAIEHCYRLIDILSGKLEGVGVEEDAGAVAWLGLVMGSIESTEQSENLHGGHTEVVANNMDTVKCDFCHVTFRAGERIHMWGAINRMHLDCYKAWLKQVSDL